MSKQHNLQLTARNGNENSLLIYLFISFSVVAGPVDDHKPFAKEINNNATDSVKTGDPWNVPNYEEPHPNYDHLMNNSEQLKQEGLLLQVIARQLKSFTAYLRETHHSKMTRGLRTHKI
ncbi:hypothetical protein H2136_20530 [Aeromonas hydrophila]|uniref:Uncharacterized protein n=1 Tax=Aeromonas hydrophila TaxID=644 RepID=A0A926ITV7_AERHY|nr:hypothetical protein [Aeromonas hydrophila]